MPQDILSISLVNLLAIESKLFAEHSFAKYLLCEMGDVDTHCTGLRGKAAVSRNSRTDRILQLSPAAPTNGAEDSSRDRISGGRAAEVEDYRVDGAERITL